MIDCQACAKVKEECQQKLDQKKTSFNELKRKIQEIETTEAKIKDHLEELQRERNICKEKCDKVKQNIKLNRTKYGRSIEEFGKDNELDDDAPAANPHQDAEQQAIVQR